jgi:hypothetical protein
MVRVFPFLGNKIERNQPPMAAGASDRAPGNAGTRRFSVIKA